MRDCRGSVVVELAMVLPLVLVLVFGLLDLGLFMLANLKLQSAVLEGGRLVWTGQVQTAADGQAAFRKAVCDRAAPVIPCGAILFDVQVFPSFAAIDAKPTFKADGTVAAKGFTPGAPEEIAVARVFYVYPMLTPVLGPLLGSSSQLITAVAVFRNEPFRD